MPIRQPNGQRRPRVLPGHEDRLLSRRTRGLRRWCRSGSCRHRPARLPRRPGRAGSARRAGGRRSPSLLQCSLIASSMLGGSGEEALALAPVRAQLDRVRRGDPPALAGERSCSRKPGLRAASSRSAAPKITPSAVRAECRCTTSRSSPPRSMLRSMLMIGVMPLPALMNSSFAGSGSGSTNVAFHSAEPDDRPRAPRCAPDTARPCRRSTSLGVMRCSRPAGRGRRSSSRRASGGCRRPACPPAGTARACARATPSRA